MKTNNCKIQEKSFEDLITEMLLDRKGGKTTVKIIDTLWDRPMNKNQLANAVGVDYNTIKHHTNLLIKVGIVKISSKKYGATLRLTPRLLNNEEDYEKVKKLLILND